ncbi:MAG: hypothetical protein M3017_00440 [Actinomycetota bacterium]|nr:hypothetical protein [Actinomycetota bacterium]
MQIDKQQIIDYLRNRGDHDKATQAESELPESVDADKDSGLLSKLGIQPEELLGGHPPGPSGMGTPGGLGG